MSYEKDDEATDRRKIEESIQSIRDTLYEELVNIGEENVGVPLYDQQGKFRDGEVTTSGGLSEPVILGVNTLSPQTLPTKTTIPWNTKNPQHIILDRAVEFDFTDLPASGNYEGVLIIIDIDGTGGFDSPIWPASLLNPPVIPTTALSRFSVMLYTIDAGTIVTYSTSVGSSSSGSGFSGNLSDLIINVNKDWSGLGISNLGSLTGVTEIDMDGATAKIQGITSLEYAQAGQSIIEKADPDGGLLYNVNGLQSHTFLADTDEIAKFEESASNVFRLNMLDHSIRDAKDISFDVNATFAGSGAVPTIGFDSAGADLFYNAPDNAKHVWTTNNTELMGLTASQLTFAQGLKIQPNPNATNPGLSVGSFAGDPASNTDGDIWYNSTTNKYRVHENGVDLDILTGTGIDPATTELDNLTTTSINAALLPEDSATLDLGSELLPWRIGHFREIEFPVDASVPSGATDTQISKNASGNLAFNNQAAGGGFLYYFEGVNKWSMTSTSLSGDFIILQNSLVLNNSATNPAGDGELTRNGDSVILQSPAFQIQRAITGTFAGDFNLTKVDAAPSGGEPIYKINFSLFDSPTTTIYSQIRSEIRDVTDAGRLYLSVRADNNASLVDAIEIIGDDNNLLSFMNINSRISSDLVFGQESGSTDLKIFPQVNSLGIVVQDNVSFTVGTGGMLSAPIVSILPSTAAGADATFGNHVGAIGFFDNGVDGITLLVRQLDGNWGGLNLARDQIT